MANYNELKASIEQQIRSNGNQEITGAVLQAAMLNMVDVLGENTAWGGIISPTSTHAELNTNTLYIASEAGTYANFGGVTVEKDEIAAIYYDGASFTKQTVMKVGQVLANLVGTSQEVLNMLAELAEYLAQDPNLATSLATALANKADKSSTVQGYGIQNAVIIADGGYVEHPKCDELITPGFYTITAGNADDGWPDIGRSVYGNMIVIRGDSPYFLTQVLFTSYGAYYRVRSSNFEWGDWHKISQE